MKDNHKKYIQRTFYLAKKGKGRVAPNPLVGCVIVKNNIIIGEGYHKKFGENHAEINAINNVVNKNDIKGSTVYINLEPCNHYGKTPPCSDELVKLQPKEVIVSNKDPNPLTNGKSLQKLKENNIQVKSNILEKEGYELNKRFFKNQYKKLPYVILKWAQTEDGFLAKEDGSSKWISSDISRTLVHKWRSEEAVEYYSWKNGDNGVEVDHYKVIGGGHYYPKINYENSKENGDIDSDQLIWEFFSRFDINGLR